MRLIRAGFNLLAVAPGFAVNLQVILANPRAQFKRRGSQPGMQESDFLKQITKVTDLEPKANNCTRVSECTFTAVLVTMAGCWCISIEDKTYQNQKTQ